MNDIPPLPQWVQEAARRLQGREPARLPGESTEAMRQRLLQAAVRAVADGDADRGVEILRQIMSQTEADQVILRVLDALAGSSLPQASRIHWP
jgi:hypothetical protein